jgi:aspartyl-tRNA(Asn)/glutamyl-tRNA(Gln) amidotransferase subunit B
MPENIPFPPQFLAELLQLIDKGTISGRIAKDVFVKMFDTGKKPSQIVAEDKLEVVSDEQQLGEIVRKVVDSNPESVRDYKNGKTKAIGFLVGQVMKETKGKADPRLVNKLLAEELDR